MTAEKLNEVAQGHPSEETWDLYWENLCPKISKVPCVCSDSFQCHHMPQLFILSSNHASDARTSALCKLQWSTLLKAHEYLLLTGTLQCLPLLEFGQHLPSIIFLLLPLNMAVNVLTTCLVYFDEKNTLI